ncbi:MAG TPA: hypothetical protein ENH07_00575 [Nitrospirae bacterium]|nr:hypothetical protein [Nitrospirota bacterium]HDY71563.1 hypothetical protein [Nitrospirota bacterium]
MLTSWTGYPAPNPSAISTTAIPERHGFRHCKRGVNPGRANHSPDEAGTTITVLSFNPPLLEPGSSDKKRQVEMKEENESI